MDLNDPRNELLIEHLKYLNDINSEKPIIQNIDTMIPFSNIVSLRQTLLNYRLENDENKLLRRVPISDSIIANEKELRDLVVVDYLNLGNSGRRFWD